MMGKYVHPDVLDAELAAIADGGNRMFVCSAQPADYTEASATYALGEKILVTGHGNGVYTIAAASGGRKVTVAEQAGIVITGPGTANHVAICSSTSSKVLFVTEMNSAVTVASGQTITIEEIIYTVTNPT